MQHQVGLDSLRQYILSHRSSSSVALVVETLLEPTSLKHVGIFADGVAVKRIGLKTFKLTSNSNSWIFNPVTFVNKFGSSLSIISSKLLSL